MLGIRDLVPFLFLIYLFSDSVLRRKPNYMALIIFGYLLGFFRRFLPNDSIFTNTGLNFDPLLLVIPISLLLNFSFSKFSSLNSKLLDQSLKALILISTLEIFNFRQGSILVGVTGWLAYVCPILFVFMGASISKMEFEKILQTLKIIGLVVCIYGLSQVVFGYSQWDQKWFDLMTSSGDYSVLAFGTNRPFGTFSSIGEYAQAIGIAAGIVTYQYMNAQLKFLTFIFYISFFLLSATLTASRSALIFVFLVAFSPLVIAARIHFNAKFIFTRVLPLIFSSTLLLPIIFQFIPQNIFGNAASLISRQAVGVSGNNSGVTPASVHITQTLDAFKESFSSIFGFGVGSISGAQKLNGLTRTNFESDIGNAAYAFGILGFIVMIAIFIGMYSALSSQKSGYSILLVFILLVSFNNWFNPGHYATEWVVWLLVGVMLNHREAIKSER